MPLILTARQLDSISRWNERMNEGGKANQDEVKEAKTWRDYMAQKTTKLAAQFEADSKNGGGTASLIFSGVTIWVDGLTDPPSGELRDAMAKHGGRYEHFFRSSAKVTHVVATVLPDTKATSFRSCKVVLPSWVRDSIKAGKRLPEEPYLLKPMTSRGTITSHFGAQQQLKQVKCTDTMFLQNYFNASRLHHISSWKMQFGDELRSYLRKVANVQPCDTAVDEDGDGGDGCAADGSDTVADFEAAAAAAVYRGAGERVLLHVDIDCFFVSVSVREHSELRGLPVVVCHSHGPSAEVACASYEAREFGIHNGMMMSSARELCPAVTVAPYEFAAYESTSKELYRILLRYTSAIEVRSCDEAIVDVTGSEQSAESIGEAIRSEFFSSTYCTASVGIGPNPLLAKLACKTAKPNGMRRIAQSEAAEHIAGLEVGNLPGVGPSVASALLSVGIEKCGDVLSVPAERLSSAVGKARALKLRELAAGIDATAVRPFMERGCVSVIVTWGVRFERDTEVTEFLGRMAEELSRRLIASDLVGSVVHLQWKRRQANAPPPRKYLGHGHTDDFQKRILLPSPTDDKREIERAVIGAYAALHENATEIRGLGLSMRGLKQKSTATAKQRQKPIQEFFAESTSVQQQPQQGQKRGSEGPKRTISEEELDAMRLPPETELDYGIIGALPDDIRSELVGEYTRKKREATPPVSAAPKKDKKHRETKIDAPSATKKRRGRPPKAEREKKQPKPIVLDDDIDGNDGHSPQQQQQQKPMPDKKLVSWEYKLEATSGASVASLEEWLREVRSPLRMHMESVASCLRELICQRDDLETAFAMLHTIRHHAVMAAEWRDGFNFALSAANGAVAEKHGAALAMGTL